MTTHPGQVNQQRRRNRQAMGVGVFLAVVSAIALIGNINGDSTAGADEAPRLSQSEAHQVVYEIDGSAIEVSVTLSTPTGTQQMDANARLAGDDLHEMTVDSSEFLYISAQNQNELGTIVCRIIVDGAVIAENESTASFGIATCEGTAG